MISDSDSAPSKTPDAKNEPGFLQIRFSYKPMEIRLQKALLQLQKKRPACIKRRFIHVVLIVTLSAITLYDWLFLIPIPYVEPTFRHIFVYSSFLYPNSQSFGTSNVDTLVTLYMADTWEIVEHVRCIRGNVSEQDWVPATVTKIDYVGLCRLVIYVLSCNIPITSKKNNDKEKPPLYIDFGQRVMADLTLPYKEPVLTQVIPKSPDRKKRQMVMCISRVFAFEKWQLLVTALEVYKLLKVDLVVAHVNSVLTPIFQLMKAYETDGILAIRPGIRFPYLKNMNYDPNTEIEYSGQLMLAHECFYEFRESAEFIALLDWDDLLITTQYTSLGKAFHEAALHFPQAPYFLVNKLETTFMEQDKEPTRFSIRRLVEQGILTKFAYNNEKMVVRPKNIVAFWVHFTRSMPYDVKPKSVTLSNDYSIILHLARKSKKGGRDGYSHKYLSQLNLTALEENTYELFRRPAMRELIKSLPNATHYFDAISDCSRYMNALPTFAGGNSPCLSYTMCTFPKLSVRCVVADGEYRTKVVMPTTIYSIHTRIRSGFKERLNGCFDANE